MALKKIVALDGPAGSGKSTVARHLSETLNYEYLDSGAMYRTLTLYGLQNLGSSCKGREDEIATWFIDHPEGMTITYENHIQVMWLNDKNVSSEIRSPEVTRDVRYVSDCQACREIVNRKMRHLAEQYPVVIDGRDIGTKVFPDTPNKFYLDARPEIRATRRALENGISTQGTDFDQLLADIMERDAGDMAREIAPLRQAEDAILIDTSDLTVEEVVERIRLQMVS